MRPMTNLRQQVQFKLEPAELRSNFCGIFDPKLGSKNVLNDVYYYLCTGAFMPGTRNIQADAKQLKESVQEFLRDKDRKRVVKSTLRKNNGAKRLEFRTPLCVVFDGNIGSVLRKNAFFPALQKEATEAERSAWESLETGPLAGGKIITGKQVAADFKNINQKARALFAGCLEKLEATKDGDNVVTLWATFIITQKEAEYLCNCKWVELRLSDIYPTLIDWIASIFGRYTRLPKTISKVSMIATEVKDTLKTAQPGTVKPRVGVDNIVADIQGAYYVIPEVDQAAQYEQMLMDFGLKEDGSYSWAQVKKLGSMTSIRTSGEDEEDEESSGEGNDDAMEDEGVDVNDLQTGKKKLPANMPIFSDWLNDKFIYSNTAGNLAVYDLSDTVPATARHFTQFFDERITGSEKRGEGPAAFFNQMVSVGGGLDGSIWDEEPKAEDCSVAQRRTKFMQICTLPKNDGKSFGFQQAMDKAFRITAEFVGEDDDGQVYETNVGGVRMKYVKFEDLTPDSPYDAFKFVGRMVAKACAAIEENIEVLYTRMSVMSALQLLAYAKMMKNSAPHSKQIRELDMQERGKYANQGVDPKYKPKPIPNIKDDLAFQPHQAKVDNLMREHPKFAAYPVDAGGGKTILILTNILQEMRDGLVKRPIVACPSTLVDQYVQEAVFVSEGRVNIIPVTNATVRMHGLERLQKMIESAPPNTVVVTDFDFVKGKNKTVAYGNRAVTVWNNAEWLRQFQFDLIAVDEVHKLKNLASARRHAMARLMQDIEYKRLASGTLVDDVLTDLVSQIALFDPTIFGSPEKFKADYAANEKGGKVLAWRKGAQKEIQQKISENCIWAQARRKEWAALLPEMVEEFHAVDLSENQRLLYDSILKETTDLIEEAMAKDPELAEAIAAGDESLADDLESMLRPYLARLERFLSAPDMDEAAPIFLQNEADKVSPKVRLIHEICQKHLDRKLPGKIVIFTNYTGSAAAVYKYAPPALKKQMIHYTAGRKMECRAQFAKDDKMTIMVGQSSSMDTGINFQMASRLIRMETIWTPGALEQGNARINRPQLKKKEERKRVYFDWLMVNRTIDVTKVARLTAKVISKTKFDNAQDPEYDALPDVPVIPMRISTIAAKNDFQEELRPYMEAYRDMQHVRNADYARYKEANKDKMDPVAVPQGGMLKGSKLMSRVPYVPGMTIYGTEQLGLVRYDEFCNIDLEELELEELESEGEGANDDVKIADNDPKKLEKERHKAFLQARWAKELELAMNMPCHTEFGDGVIYGAKKRVWVELKTGEKMRIPKLQVFIITRTTTNSKDMRKELLKAVGDLPLTEPIEVPVEVGGETNKRRRAQQEADERRGRRGGRKIEEPEEVEDQTPHASFQFTVINDMMAIMFDVENSSDEAASAVQNYGFKISPEYWFTRVKGPVIMLKLLQAWKAKGYLVDRKAADHLHRIWDFLKTYGREKIGEAGFASDMDITHFHREIIKPSADPKMLKVYPMVQDGVLYFILPKKGQAANAKAIRVPAPEIKWQEGGGEGEMLRFCNDKNEAQQVLREIKDSGINILNLEELGQQWKAIRVGKKTKK